MANLVDVTDAPQSESADDALDSYVDEILGEEPETAPEPEEIEAAPEPEAEGEPEPEAEEKPEEETPEYITIRANGKDIELTYDEVIEHAQKGLDYYKKTTELAEQRKTFDVERQQMQQQMQMQNALFTDFAELKAIDSQLDQYSKADWNTYYDQDPVAASKAWVSYQQLQNQRSQKVSELQNKQQYISQQAELNRQQMIERGMAELKASIRDWTPERGQELAKFGVETYGFTQEEIGSIVDPRQIRVLNDAAKYRELQAKKPAITKKVAEAPKNIKPGNTPKTDEKAEAAKALRAMRASKSRVARERIADSLLDRFVS